jgi:hypothetical protein
MWNLLYDFWYDIHDCVEKLYVKVHKFIPICVGMKNLAIL